MSKVAKAGLDKLHISSKLAQCVLLSMLCHGAMIQSSSAMTPEQMYEVKSGTLTQALNQIATQAKISLLMDRQQTDQYQIQSFKAHASLESIFNNVLLNTPFKMVYSQGNYIIVSQEQRSTEKNQRSKQTMNDENNQLYQMPTIQASSTQSETQQFGQSVLNQKNIDQYQANNVAQLLDTMPGVASSGSPRPGGQTLNILGMGGVEDVPITIDGSLKTFDKYRQGSVFIEPELLKKVTVDKGPHNVEVGNGGFGGQVTLETKEAVDLLLPDRHIGAFLKYSNFSNNNQNTYTGSVYGKTKNDVFDGMLYFTKRDSGDVSRPDGTKFLYSAQDQNTYLAKFNITPNTEHRFSFNIMRSDHKGWEPFAAKRDIDSVPTQAEINRYGYDEAWQRKLVYRKQLDKNYSAQYQYTPENNPYIHLTAKLSYSETSQHDVRPDSVSFLAANLGNESWVSYKNTNASLINISHLDTGILRHQIKVGMQYQKMKQQSLTYVPSYKNSAEYNYGYFEPNFMPAGDQELFAGFIEDQISLGSVTVSPSLRYDHIVNTGYGNRAPRYSVISVGQDYSEKTYTGWSPRIALAWQQNSHLTWFANLSNTWRAPRVDEQYYVDSPTSSVPATSLYLKPEKMLALRLGHEMNFDGLLADQDHLQVRLTYHHNQGKNEIFRNRSVFCKAQADLIAQGKTARAADCNGNYDKGFYRNLTPYTIQAYEAEIFYTQPRFFAGLTYAYIRGERDNSPVNPWFAQKTWIEEVAPRKATATLGFNIPEKSLSAGWRGIFVDAQNRSILNTDNSIGASGFSLPRTKGYALHSIFVDWQVGQRGPHINFSIDNLFNRDYKMYLGEYMTGTGRDYKLSISQKF